MTNTNESGRSMVEMLGVLAIIGVLSVMGIAGYTQAMKKYKTNEAIATISMAAMLCGSGQGASATSLSNDYVDITGCESNGAAYDLKTGVDEDQVTAALSASPYVIVS